MHNSHVANFVSSYNHGTNSFYDMDAAESNLIGMVTRQNLLAATRKLKNIVLICRPVIVLLWKPYSPFSCSCP